MSVLRLHAQAIWSHTCLLCPLSLARSLPPFLSISACDCSTTEGRGRGFLRRRRCDQSGARNTCVQFLRNIDSAACEPRQPRSHSSPLSLSLSFSPSQQSACLSTVFLPFPGMLFCSLCPSVLHRLSFLLLRDSMHFWLIPTFAGLAERAGRQSCQFGHMTCYSRLAWAGRGRRGGKKRGGEEGVGIEEGMHSSTSLWASLFLLLQRAILSKRPLYWTGEIGGRVTKGRMLIACRHGENVKIKCALCL